MRIKSVHIENFRSVRDLTCAFDQVTSLIGPNGSGKSNILRALDWFFNGERSSLTEADLFQGAEQDARIRVRVDFGDLTDGDRQALGPRYCPDGQRDEFTAWRTWVDGQEKITGRALALPAFERIRAVEKAGDRRQVFNEQREAYGLPAWTSAAAAEAQMFQWELDHPDQLEESEVSATHFFGVNGQGVLSELFDFIFVSADLRAGEETIEKKDSLLERILRRTIQREDFDAAVQRIADSFEQQYRSLGEEHLDGQLSEIATELTAEVASYSPGRTIDLSQEPGAVRAIPSSIIVSVADDLTQTPVTHQGHGFQRTLLLAGLTVLARQARDGAQPASMVLAIEEPELFQHPTQARAFASVLRNLAQAADQRTQVVYATHSPHFVSPEYFDEVRRISPRRQGAGHAETTIRQATLADVQSRLETFVNSDAVARRFQQVCLNSLPDGLFAEKVLLVEGDDDAAILEGVGERVNSLAVHGVCVAPVFGKQNMMIPYAILEALGIPTVMVVDNDSGCGTRMRALGRTDEQIEEAERKHVRDNRSLCRFVRGNEEDYPVGRVAGGLVFVPDTLEALLASDLPGWDLSRQRLIEDGRGVEGKHAGTYALAVRECGDEIGPDLKALAEVCLGEVA